MFIHLDYYNVMLCILIRKVWINNSIYCSSSSRCCCGGSSSCSSSNCCCAGCITICVANVVDSPRTNGRGNQLLILYKNLVESELRYNCVV